MKTSSQGTYHVDLSIGTNHSDKSHPPLGMNDCYGSSIGTSQSVMFKRHANEWEKVDHFDRSFNPLPTNQKVPSN